MYYVCTLVCGGEFGGDTLRALAIAQCCFDRGWESLSKRDVKIDFKIHSQFSTTFRTHMNQSKVDVYGRTIVPIFCGQSFSTSCMEATVLGHGDDHLCDHSAKSLSPRPPPQMQSENRLRVVGRDFDTVL